MTVMLMWIPVHSMERTAHLNGMMVGSIRQVGDEGETIWRWMVDVRPTGRRTKMDGFAHKVEDAQARLSEAVEKWIDEMGLQLK